MQIRNSQNSSEETPLHSHSFVSDDSSTIGSTNSESFNVRKQRERNRIFVPGYKRSIIGQPVMARKYQRPAGRSAEKPPTTGRQQQSAAPQSPVVKPPESRFHEPPTRTYNPYG